MGGKRPQKTESKEFLGSTTKDRSSLFEENFFHHFRGILSFLRLHKKRLEGVENFLSDIAAETGSTKELHKVYSINKDAVRQAILIAITEVNDRRMRWERRSPRLSDYDIKKKIGQGGYGEVYMCKLKEFRESKYQDRTFQGLSVAESRAVWEGVNKAVESIEKPEGAVQQEDSGVYALKRIRKDLVIHKNEVVHINAERKVLAAGRSKWIVEMHSTFQDPSNLYIAMEFVPGGDMRTFIIAHDTLDDMTARFFTAEMFICIQVLHNFGFIHRDLKPENFLIDSQGHLKLTDFGLAVGFINEKYLDSLQQKVVQLAKNQSIRGGSTLTRSCRLKDTFRRQIGKARRAKSAVGTPDYMAPETFTAKSSGQLYDHRVDYWSVGCIMYEMIAGYPPFMDERNDLQQVFSNIIDWENSLGVPVDDSGEPVITHGAWNFLDTKIFVAQPNRIQSLAEVESDPYFADLNFKAFRDTPSKWKPKLGGDGDVSHFEDFDDPNVLQGYEDMNLKMAAIDVSHVQERHHLFAGWTLSRKAAYPGKFK